jgi:polysaccharide export outer membrane protein
VFAADKRIRFADVFAGDKSSGYRVGAGDVLEVSIWEAPPATLFGSTVLDPRLGAATARVTTFPEQMVSHEGTINVPFAGAVPAAGKSPQQVETEIARRLQGKANQPQVLVRVTRNVTSNVTVVGEVTQSVRMPLTAKGERLLDSIAAAGGVRQPVGKMTVQVTRGEVVQAMALDSVIQDPKQNIVLQPGDVVTALFQPLSFTALGATGKNEEVFFEAQGITLAQALARSGGLQDHRADAKGVFIFRYEEPLVLGIAGENPPLTPDGKVPVIYRVDLKDPRSFFVAQGFPIRNKDVMYVSNAPAAELQKFLNILTSVVFTAQGLGAIGK